MELTRRDAVAALAAIGGTATAGIGYARLRSGGDGATEESELPSDPAVKEAMVAIAAVVYPSELSGIESFVDEFLQARLETDEHATGIRESVAELERRAKTWHDGRVSELPAERREQLLREVGAQSADEDPAGRTSQRVRYYIVNELLLALYSSPKGGKLVGLENPQGHPGGTESYQRGPR